MKIERLVSIIMILLQRKKVTAAELATRFQVSKRTIYRDLTDLCLAGIPIITMAGTDGGILIADDYKIDKTLFTERELYAIFAGLLSLDSISSKHQYQKIISKFLDLKQFAANNHMLICLSSHYKETLAPKIEQIQQAIESLQQITFDYYNAQGEQQIILEPHLLIYQWSAWYVFGYRAGCGEFRMYKLNRVWSLQLIDQPFAFREIPQEKLEFDRYFTNEIQAVILFDKTVAYRLIEEYGQNCYKPLANGKLLFEFPFTNKEYLFHWVLGFADKAELLEPVEFRAELKERVEKLLQKYAQC